MSIQLEFINLIIPVTTINKYYKGGIDQYKTDSGCDSGGKIWSDEYLVRDGSMNGIDMLCLVDYWKSKGVKTTKTVNNIMCWDELCVVDTVSGPTLQCDWLKINEDNTVEFNEYTNKN